MLNQASIALIAAVGVANVCTSRFFADNPDAYEEALDQIFIHELHGAIRPLASRVFSDGSRIGYSAKYCGRRATIHYRNVRTEVADLLIALRINCKGVIVNKALMLQAKRLRPTNRFKGSGGVYGNPYDEIGAFIASELGRPGSHFECDNKYRALKAGDPQWNAVDLVNRLSKIASNSDLVFYSFQNPLNWPSCSTSSHRGDLAIRVLSQGDIGTGNELCSDLSGPFLAKRSLIEEWVADVLQCRFGYRVSGQTAVQMPHMIFTAAQREPLQEILDRPISRPDRQQAANELAELLSNHDPNGERVIDTGDFPVYLDVSQCSKLALAIYDSESEFAQSDRE